MIRKLWTWFRSLFRKPVEWFPHGFGYQDPHRALRDLFPMIRGDLSKPTPRRHQPFRQRLVARDRRTFARYRRQPNYRALSRALEAVLRDALVPAGDVVQS